MSATEDQSAPLPQEIREIERSILKAEQELLGEINACKRRNREQQAGSPRSYGLEDARRQLRRIATIVEKSVAEARVTREALVDLRDRLLMAAKRMSAKTGAEGLDRERNGMVEAYMDSAREVTTLLSLPQPVSVHRRQGEQKEEK
jgi:hypothetical protein